MVDYNKMANDFLEKAGATCDIEFAGRAINRDWKEKEARNSYAGADGRLTGNKLILEGKYDE